MFEHFFLKPRLGVEGKEQIKSGTLMGQLSKRAMTPGIEITLVLVPSLQKIILPEKLSRKCCQDLCNYKTVLLDFPLASPEHSVL